jgi:CS domain
MFTCVILRCSGASEELQLSASGGLEADELQKYAKDVLFNSPHDVTANRDILEQQMKEHGSDLAKVDEKIIQQHIGQVHVEIKTLSPPSQANGYIGVSMYCDANAALKQTSINSTATAICMKCGYTTPVLGDVLISRVHDNEDLEWKRLDFTALDLKEDAPWLLQATLTNQGKNMDKFSSSGAMSNMLQSSDVTSSHSSDVSGKDKDGLLSWKQTNEDVEVQIKIPEGYKAKDIKVVIKQSRLWVVLPQFLGDETDTHPSDLRKIQTGPAGAELFAAVDVDESSWSVDGAGANRVLNISLVKGKAMRWLTVVR